MGLLDEAIREHLELKRRLGADPGEIARKEREALAPVVPEDPSTWEGHGADEVDAATEAHDVVPGETSGSAEVSESGGGDEFTSVGQETAELDMRTVLDEDAAGGHIVPEGDGGAAPVRAVRAGEPAEEALGWELAGEPERLLPAQEIPGQERLTFE